MALPSCPLDSRMGTHLSRCPTNHPNTDNMECTEEGERVNSWQRPEKEITTWEEEEGQDPPTTELMPKD